MFRNIKADETTCFLLLCVFSSVAHLGEGRDDSHIAICCFEGRPRGDLNANQLSFLHTQLVHF